MEFNTRLSGTIASGGTQTFGFEGLEGQSIIVDIGLRFAPLGMQFSLHAPDSTLVEQTDATQLGPVVLPVSGRYTIVLQSAAGRFTYNLLLSDE